MKAVILAGGFGRRLGEKYKDIPKPLIEVCGKPVILREIETLRREGVIDFIIVTCYLHEKIENYLGDGKKFGVNIEYYNEDEPLGTAGALFKLNLKETFLFINGDLVFDFSLKKMIDFHNTHNALITTFVHPNSHPYDSTLIECNNDGLISDLIFSNKPEYYSNLCNAGIQLISSEVFAVLNKKEYADFDKDILLEIIKIKKAFAYKSTEYVADMGTPDRLNQVESDMSRGLVQSKNITLKQKAVFLDRDGTINKYKGYITEPESIELIPGAAEAITLFHQKGYLVIIITNQPVIARGECTFEELDKIHRKLQMFLSESGAYIDDLFFCPHHPDGGFEGEIKAYKCKCLCRKPAPGMIFEAAQKYNINLSVSYIAGDSQRDVETAKNAGCIPVYISNGNKPLENILTFNCLSDFSEYLKKDD